MARFAQLPVGHEAIDAARSAKLRAAMKEQEMEVAAGIANLSILARAMGFANGVDIEFVDAMRGKVGAFSRFATMHGVAIEIAVAAKREFIAEFVA